MKMQIFQDFLKDVIWWGISQRRKIPEICIFLIPKFIKKKISKISFSSSVVLSFFFSKEFDCWFSTRNCLFFFCFPKSFFLFVNILLQFSRFFNQKISFFTYCFRDKLQNRGSKRLVTGILSYFGQNKKEE